jgi:glycerol uptake facilitator-like aquaporin
VVNRHHWSRDVVVELAGTASLLLVVLLSGTQQVQFGKGTLTDALVGSVSLGLGFALILWTFGRYTGAQNNPLVSLIATACGGQPTWRTLRLVSGQLLGATVAVAIATALPKSASADSDYIAVHLLAEGVASFAMLLVALAVAHRQDAYVPLALGGMASASVWMTGRGTLGNPVISVPVIMLATGMSHPADVLRILGAQVLGAAVAVGVAAFLFPWARQSARVLLFRPVRADES